MKLYHGSNVPVGTPRLIASDRRVDFGRGFYVTSSLDQAERWARLVTARRKAGEPTVAVYEFDEARLGSLSCRTFENPDVEWLHFVGQNRQGEHVDSGFDLVIGPVANDNTMPVLRLFFAGMYSEEETIKHLLPQKLTDQYAFKTEAALELLSFCEVKSA